MCEIYTRDALIYYLLEQSQHFRPQVDPDFLQGVLFCNCNLVLAVNQRLKKVTIFGDNGCPILLTTTYMACCTASLNTVSALLEYLDLDCTIKLLRLFQKGGLEPFEPAPALVVQNLTSWTSKVIS